MSAAFALVAVSAAALGAGGESGTSPQDAASPKRLLLRLSDLPSGYRIGDDSGCGDLSTEGQAPALSELSATQGAVRCSNEFEMSRSRARRLRVAPLVESHVVVLNTEEGAVRALELTTDILHHFTAMGGGKRAGEIPSSVRLADATRMFRSRNTLVEGLPGPGYAVAWRAGRVVGIVVAGGLSGRRGRRTVVARARTQQRRIEHPTRVKPEEEDDREVALDDPALGVDVYWLGRRFDPPGSLPPLTLRDAIGPIERGGGPGNVVEIAYVTRTAREGVTLYLWKPKAWERFKKTRLGRLVWDSPCAQTRRIPLGAGQAFVYSGYVKRRRPPCPGGGFDRFLAHAYLGDVVVAVNMPICFMCVERVPRGRTDPFNSVEGMEAVVRGLRLREPR
jgi:hypothetical protein